MSTLFALDPDLRIATIFEVSGSSIKAAIMPGLEELSKLHRGRIYGIGRIGSLVKIHVGTKLLFASLRSLRLQTPEEAAAAASLHAESRVLEADLVGEGAWIEAKSSLEFARGVVSSALPMQGIFLLTDDETKHLYRSIERARPGSDKSRVSIGTYVGPRPVECQADIDRMFGLHCAILGSTGVGKSSAVASIIWSVLDGAMEKTE